MPGFVRKFFNRINKQGFYFIHIPKTAGTSFINILDNIVSEDEIFPCQLWKDINKDVVSKKNKFKLIRGHFGGGSYNLLAESTPHLLTILRHPKNLSISTYHFIKRETNTAVHKLVTERKMSLNDFLKNPETRVKINNRMVRHLSFDLQQDPEAQELFLSPESIEVINKWIKPGKSLNNKKRLERAKSLLRRCSWFGILEQFDKSMQLYAYTFNLPPIGKTPVLNAYNPAQEIDQESVDIINSENQYDIQLYNYALELFNQKFEDMRAKLQSEYNSEKDRTLDELIDLNYQRNNSQSISHEINYDFSQRLLGAGWQRRELTLPENTYFRWTASENSFIDFWLEAEKYILKIRIINAVSEDHLRLLQLYVNNIPVEYNYDNNQGVVRILTTCLTEKHFQNSFIRIRFSHPEIIQHMAAFSGNDTRRLGIAINWIKINRKI